MTKQKWYPHCDGDKWWDDRYNRYDSYIPWILLKKQYLFLGKV